MLKQSNVWIMLAITTFAFYFCKIYFIKVIGAGIAIAVVLGASIIRIVLVPGLIKLLLPRVATASEEFAESLELEEELAIADQI